MKCMFISLRNQRQEARILYNRHRISSRISQRHRLRYTFTIGCRQMSPREATSRRLPPAKVNHSRHIRARNTRTATIGNRLGSAKLRMDTMRTRLLRLVRNIPHLHSPPPAPLQVGKVVMCGPGATRQQRTVGQIVVATTHYQHLKDHNQTPAGHKQAKTHVLRRDQKRSRPDGPRQMHPATSILILQHFDQDLADIHEDFMHLY